MLLFRLICINNNRHKSIKIEAIYMSISCFGNKIFQ